MIELSARKAKHMQAERKIEEQSESDRAHSGQDYVGTAEEKQPRYVISVAAQILGVHPQTLRLYEREGLVEPQRTGGKIRLYSDYDIEKVRCIMRLTNDLGVNLAGAEAIIYMRERMLRMYMEMETVRERMEAELREMRRELGME